MKLLLAGSGMMLVPRFAHGVTQEDVDQTEAQLAEAQAKYNEVEAQLQEIGAQFEDLSRELSGTLEDIDSVNKQIGDTESQIEEKEADLGERRSALAQRVRSAYKSGGDEALSAILLATSFEELSSNIYYMDKISGNDRRLIEDVERLKGELEVHEAELEEDRTELEGLKETQQGQLEEMQAKQEEVLDILDGLDDDVQALMAKRDDQIMELAREREEQKKREEEAKKAAEEAAAKAAEDAETLSTESGSVSSSSASSTPIIDGPTTGSQAAVIAACHSTGSPGAGYCAMWVSMVFDNAGLGYGSGNADDMYYAWTTSSNRADLKPGMIVAVSTHSHTTAGSIYGHIGIYIGGGLMMDNIGYIRTISVNEWINFYSTTVTPRWGWFMGIELA